MADDSHASARLRAVAEAFLRPRPAAAPSVVVAASRTSLPAARLGRVLFEAAAALDLPVELWTPDDEIHRGGPADTAALRVLIFGELDAESVRRLPAPTQGMGPELFLYALSPCVPQPLRELYTLSLWSWSLGARATRCLLPQPEPDRLRQTLLQWQSTPGLPKAEILGWPEGDGAALRMGQQILQSALAAGSERRAARH